MAKKYDSTVARIAGNILSGHEPFNYDDELDPFDKATAKWAVAMAREIVAEVERTEPKDPKQ